MQWFAFLAGFSSLFIGDSFSDLLQLENKIREFCENELNKPMLDSRNERNADWIIFPFCLIRHENRTFPKSHVFWQKVFYRIIPLFYPPGFRSQFTKMSTSAINSRGVAYDYDSVMHYHSTAFGSGRTTITRKDGSTKLGNTRGMSPRDIQQANLMYCNGRPTSRPTNRPVTARPPTGKQQLDTSNM